MADYDSRYAQASDAIITNGEGAAQYLKKIAILTHHILPPMPTEQAVKDLLTQSKVAYRGAVPVTIITGFLGAGKTTLIINLMKDLPKEYRVAWLKNEFGNTAVDSLLAQENNISTVKEMLQGCICHVLVGQLQQALADLLTTQPNRIIIETSGSAAPAPIVWEIRKNPALYVDGVVTVIDAKNFPGYKDKSYTAKLQAKYTDLILINKHEELSESDLEDVLDDVYELNPDTPKVKTDRGFISPNVLFGLDSQLFLTQSSVTEVETGVQHDHQALEVDIIEILPQRTFTQATLTETLKQFPAKNFYRIKGVVEVDEAPMVLNYAYGEFRLFVLSQPQTITPRLVFMGQELKKMINQIADVFDVPISEVRLTPKGHHHAKSSVKHPSETGA